MDSQYNEKYSTELKRIDWDFTESHLIKGFSSYHWYPARYVPQIAGILISYFSKPGDKILDPFSGSGTSLIEAYKLGRSALGLDINPIATLISKAKLTSFEEESFNSYSKSLVNTIAEIFEDVNFGNLDLDIPNQAENKAWYHPKTLVELGSIWVSINRHSDSPYTIVGQAAFSSMLRYCCSQNKHWGWICDNTKPKGYIYKNAIAKFKSKIKEYALNALELKEQASILQGKPIKYEEIEIQHGNNVDILATIKDESFDMVVTSPPYYNMTDYLRAQRLSFLWFDFGENMDQIKTKEIGARYKRGRIKSKDNYIAEMESTFKEIYRIMKRESYLCVVIAESPKHEPVLDLYESAMERIGYISCDVLTRSISKQRSLTPVIHTEKIYIFKKP